MTVSIDGSVGILAPAVFLSVPITVTASTYTMASAQTSFIFNGTGTIVVTLPSAATYLGQIIFVKTVPAQAVISASSNVVLISSLTAQTNILAATAGKWAIMQSNGTNWVVMASN